MRHGGCHVLHLQQQGIVVDNTDNYIDNKKNYTLILQFHPRKEIVAGPEENSKKKSSKGKENILISTLKDLR